MNRFVKFAAATLLVASATFAQEGALKVGAYVGAGLAGFNGDDAKDVDAGFGFAAGAAVVMPLYPKIDVTANVLFSMRNATYKASGLTEEQMAIYENMTDEQLAAAGINLDDLNVGGDADIAEMGIDVPVLARYKIGQLFLLAGPQLGFNISSKYDGEDFDDRASLEFGATGGAGYLISDKISVDARYYYGLTTLSDDNESTPYYAMIGATYMF